MTVRRLILLRHGQTHFNADSRMQGQLDTELTELGQAQAAAAAEELSRRQPLLVISSDLERAYRTAQIVAERAGLPLRTDPRLRETHLGHWQGLTHQEVDASSPGARLAWREDAEDAPHGGETRIDVARRSLPLVAELIRDEPQWGEDPERPVLLVTHGGLIAALTAGLLDLPVSSWPVLGGMGNGSWTQLSAHPSFADPGSVRWRLDVWNAQSGMVQVASDVL